jgi:tRNA dimethylallyltransferase
MKQYQSNKNKPLKTAKRVDNFIVCIVGPTATGKSDLAVALAKELSGEVVSADSRQVYKGLNIGTGKITKKEMAGVPHHLLDVASPKKIFSVHDYVIRAEKAIAEIKSRHHVPIICGGTGFYIQALVDGVILPEVGPNAALRKKLSKKSATELFSMLEKKDQRRASEMKKNGDFKNPPRLIRALEIIAAMGSVPPMKKIKKYQPVFIGLTLPPQELKERIRTRLIARFKKGMITEAKKLRSGGLSYARMHTLGLEYRHLAAYLKSSQKKDLRKKDTEKMIDALALDIWHYAKRQMTWFARDTRIHWVSPKTPVSKILKLIQEA